MPSTFIRTRTSKPRRLIEDPAFIGDPASIRTLASSPLHLLMSFVPMLTVYVNFTLHVLILSTYIYLVS